MKKVTFKLQIGLIYSTWTVHDSFITQISIKYGPQ